GDLGVGRFGMVSLRPTDGHRPRRLGVAADGGPGAPRRDRAARARAAARLAARPMALQDGAPRLLRRRRQGGAAARLDAEVLERGGALPDVRLVPRTSRDTEGGGRDAPCAVETAGAPPAEEGTAVHSA